MPVNHDEGGRSLANIGTLTASITWSTLMLKGTAASRRVSTQRWKVQMLTVWLIVALLVREFVSSVPHAREGATFDLIDFRAFLHTHKIRATFVSKHANDSLKMAAAHGMKRLSHSRNGRHFIAPILRLCPVQVFSRLSDASCQAREFPSKLQFLLGTAVSKCSIDEHAGSW